MSSKNTMYLMNSSNSDGALDMGNKEDREIALTEYNHNGIVDEIFCEPFPMNLNFQAHILEIFLIFVAYD